MDNVDIVIVEDNHHDVEMILDAFCELEIKPDFLYSGMELKQQRTFSIPAGNIIQEISTATVDIAGFKTPQNQWHGSSEILKSNEKTKCIPVVVFTSSNEERDRMESYKLGANSYLVKPLDADQFADHIRQIINYWINLNVNAY